MARSNSASVRMTTQPVAVWWPPGGRLALSSASSSSSNPVRAGAAQKSGKQ